MTHPIKPVARPVSRSRFGRWSDETLAVPQATAAALRQLSITSAEELLAYAETFPSAIANALDWSAAEVATAKAVLLRESHGEMAPELFEPAPSYLPMTGAREPWSEDGT